MVSDRPFFLPVVDLALLAFEHLLSIIFNKKQLCFSKIKKETFGRKKTSYVTLQHKLPFYPVGVIGCHDLDRHQVKYFVEAVNDPVQLRIDAIDSVGSVLLNVVVVANYYYYYSHCCYYYWSRPTPLVQRKSDASLEPHLDVLHKDADVLLKRSAVFVD